MYLNFFLFKTRVTITCANVNLLAWLCITFFIITRNNQFTLRSLTVQLQLQQHLSADLHDRHRQLHAPNATTATMTTSTIVVIACACDDDPPASAKRKKIPNSVNCWFNQ